MAAKNVETVTQKCAGQNGEFYHEFRFHGVGRPSWKRYGDGTQHVRVATHTGNPYLSFDVEEISLPREGRAVSRRTMVTMDKEQAAEFVAWIKEAFNL
jgi:hypothetical protein